MQAAYVRMSSNPHWKTQNISLSIKHANPSEKISLKESKSVIVKWGLGKLEFVYINLYAYNSSQEI